MAMGDNHKVNRIRLIGKLNTFLKRWWQGVMLSDKSSYIYGGTPPVVLQPKLMAMGDKSSYIYGGNREDNMLFDDLVEAVLSKLEKKMRGYALGRIDDTNFEYLRSNMMALCCKAFDVDEEIKKEKLLSKKNRNVEVENWLGQVQSVKNELRTLENEMQTKRFHVRDFLRGGRAIELGTTIHELVEQNLKVDELVHDLDGIKGETLLTRELVGEEFEKNLETILTSIMLVDRVSRVGIHGMGGVGKTTLAKHVNNRLQQTQKRVAWITVSQEFTITRLQDEIAKFVHLDLSDEDNEYKRELRLRRVLYKIKNLVFIFDDVWEHTRLRKLVDLLVANKCKLLITTRSQKVCYRLKCNRIIKATKLKENEAWNLFKVTFAGKLNLVPEVQEIAKTMVEICGGLPLGIITIAESMKGKTDYHVWRHTLAKLRESILGQDDMEEYVFKELKHSFDWLGKHEGKDNGYSNAQLCFLYCSLYPEDFKINKKELIKKFIWEEFLDKRECRKYLYFQGYDILRQLVDICLLESVTDGFVKMDKMVRAMALKITPGRTKVISRSTSMKEIPHEEEWTKDLEKMSLMKSGIKTIPNTMSPNCPRLSTLLLEQNPLKFIPQSFFLKMHSLCILDLSWTKIEKLPDSLSDIESLKTLFLTNCFNLKYLPFFGKLKKLVELDLTKTSITEMPQGIKELFFLKFLSLEECNKLAMLPEGLLLNFLYLQCLYLPYHIRAPRKEIQELKHLEEFRGWVQDAGDYNWLIKNRRSLEYHIRVGSGNMDDGGYKGYNQLVFSEYDFNLREDKDGTILGQNIHHLNLQWCKGLSNCLVDDFQMLDNPKSIRSLYIFDCEEIECLMKIEQVPNKGATMSTSSPRLPPHSFFKSLSILRISGCHEIKKLGLLTSQFRRLKELKIGCCEMIEEILEVRDDIGLGELGKASIVSLPILKHLHLVGLPSLTSICNVTMVCRSIKKVTLRRCQALEKLPLVFGEPNYDCPPSALREICLRKDEKEWWEKLELGHPSHHSLLQPFIKWFNH